MPVDTHALATLFHDARTLRAWRSEPVAPELLETLWELTVLGPTAMNGEPLRVVFVTSDAGRERLRPTLDEGNVAKTMSAPVTAILAADLAFPDLFEHLAPGRNNAAYFAGKPELTEGTARTNAWLQAGYFILAARSLGLDVGPMAGFDADRVDREFFAGTAHRSILLCNLGYGDTSGLPPRSPRLRFAQGARVV